MQPRWRAGPTGSAFKKRRKSQQAIGLEWWWPALLSRGTAELRELGNGGATLALQGSAAHVLDHELGWALDCNGTTDYASLANVPTTVTDTFTWSCWVNFDVLVAGDFYCLFSYGGYVSGGFLINRAGAYDAKIGFAWGGTDFYLGAPVTATGEWIFQAITVEAGTPTWHYLGRESTGLTKTAFTRAVGSGTLSVSSPQTVSIGRREDAGIQYCDARFGDHRLYARVLLEEDVARLYEQNSRWDLYELKRAPRSVGAAAGGVILTAAAAVASWVGQAASVAAGGVAVVASAASASWVGQAATVAAAKLLAASAAVGSWVAQAAGLGFGSGLSAGPAAGVWTAQGAGGFVLRTLAAGAAAAVWTGVAVTVGAAVSVIGGAAAGHWFAQTASVLGGEPEEALSAAVTRALYRVAGLPGRRR